MTTKVIIIGAGVSGLTCGIRLLESGRAVEIWARDVPLRTTSRVAAACWYPFLVQPADAGLRWGGVAFREFSRLAEEPGVGVVMRWCRVLFNRKTPDPAWAAAVPTFRRPASHELPPGFVDGFVFLMPVMEMPVYLPYLQKRFERLGGTLTLREIARVEEALAVSDVVVNCTGLGARELVGDGTLYALRGQMVLVERGDVEESVMDSENTKDVTYIIPRTKDCILGGTKEESEDLTVNPATAAGILERCCKFEPRLRNAKRLDDIVGLRPCRPTVRLEAEYPAAGKLLVHNYGHGGAGVTLSWGCAEEVAGIVAGHDNH